MLRLQRDRVRIVIRRNPVTVQLVRQTLVPDGAGGKRKGAPITLPPQTFRIYTDQARITTEERGETTIVDRAKLRLLAEYNADIADGDTFVHDGIKYVVMNPVPVRAYGDVVRIDADLERSV